MPQCEYDLTELVLGENWTEHRMNSGRYVCRQCASLIARGMLRKADRIVPMSRPATYNKTKANSTRLTDPSTVDMTRHNVEMVGETKARQMAERKARIARQMTPEMMIELARPAKVRAVKLKRADKGP